MPLSPLAPRARLLLLSAASRRAAGRRHPVALLAALLLPIAGLGLGACAQGDGGGDAASGPAARAPSPEATPKPRAVRVTKVRVGPMRELVRYVGTVRPHRQVNVVAQVPGRLTELPVARGASFAQGDVLARLESPELGARLARVRAELQRARTERGWACERLATDERLHAAGALPKAQLDQTRRACQGAKAAVRAGQAQLREVQAQLEKTTERAPFAGRVLRWVAEPGQNLMPGRPLVVVAGEEREVLVRVGEDDLRRGVRLGTAALLDVRSPAPPLRAEVTRVAALATGPTRAFDVVIALPDATLRAAPASFRVGMSVDVSFVLREVPGAVAVPERAVRRAPTATPGRGTIFLASGGRAHRSAVSLGLRAAGWVAVTPPPAPDARIILTGVETLTDGAPIFAVSEPMAPEATPPEATPPEATPPGAAPPALAPSPGGPAHAPTSQRATP